MQVGLLYKFISLCLGSHLQLYLSISVFFFVESRSIAKYSTVAGFLMIQRSEGTYSFKHSLDLPVKLSNIQVWYIQPNFGEANQVGTFVLLPTTSLTKKVEKHSSSKKGTAYKRERKICVVYVCLGTQLSFLCRR